MFSCLANSAKPSLNRSDGVVPLGDFRERYGFHGQNLYLADASWQPRHYRHPYRSGVGMYHMP
jgi:hypothetical protein